MHDVCMYIEVNFDKMLAMSGMNGRFFLPDYASFCDESSVQCKTESILNQRAKGALIKGYLVGKMKNLVNNLW